MKKILAIVLAVVMLFSIAACNSSNNDVNYWRGYFRKNIY